MKYIDAEKLIAELRRQKHELELSIQSQGDYGQSCHIVAYENILSLITSLQQEPRFPQYDNIIEKVFGAGNLEGWEFREAEMLVALAKEELLKSLQQEQPDFPTTDDQIKEFLATHPEIKMPEKYKNPDWLFKKQEQSDVFGTVAFQKGVKEGERLAVETIRARIDEILGDAQPNPILRMELNELIKKIEA